VVLHARDEAVAWARDENGSVCMGLSFYRDVGAQNTLNHGKSRRIGGISSQIESGSAR
jgi:hypothetical protein